MATGRNSDYIIPETAQRQTPAHRQDWLDVMARIQAIRDEIMGRLDKIDEVLNGLAPTRNRDTQESVAAQSSMVSDEHVNTHNGETKLEFALRTEAEIRESVWRARSAPTEPPHSYPHDIG